MVGSAILGIPGLGKLCSALVGIVGIQSRFLESTVEGCGLTVWGMGLAVRSIRSFRNFFGFPCAGLSRALSVCAECTFARTSLSVLVWCLAIRLQNACCLISQCHYKLSTAVMTLSGRDTPDLKLSLYNNRTAHVLAWRDAMAL